MPGAEISLGIEYLTPDATTALPLTKVPSVLCIAMIQCQKTVDVNTKGNVAVRWTNDGSTPTKDIGIELNPGDTLVTTANIDQLKFIGVAVNAKINVRYEPWPRAINRVY